MTTDTFAEGVRWSDVLAAAKPHPEVAETPKRKRTRLAQAEVWILLAQATEHLRDYSTIVECVRIKYGLSDEDFKRLLSRMADQLETKAEKCGFDEHWFDDEVEELWRRVR